MVPLLSTGGLAEVAGALPRALRARGHDVRLAMPCYRQIPAEHRGEQHCLCVADFGNRVVHGAMRVAKVPDADIPLYLIEHEAFFGRETPYGAGAYEYDDNAERFSFFCLALLHAIPQTGWTPDVVHCHDWHTAPIPTFLKTRYYTHPHWSGVASVFTIHNLAYQGRYDAARFAGTGFAPELFTPDCLEYEGDLNMMKGALVFADKLSTVSPRYAREIQTVEYGSGLHGVLSARREDLRGILNGVDYSVWRPSADAFIARRYDVEHLEDKQYCKAALQDLFGLPRKEAPLFGLVSRLHWQKGIDLLADALEEIMSLDLQLVILGAGDPALEERIAEAKKHYPDKLGVTLGFNVAAAHAVQAGSDFLLMPSRYEPCGLGQLYALAYGTIPIVRRTGGLYDTVRPYRAVMNDNSDATGIAFVPLTAQAVVRSIRTALDIYRDKPLLKQMRVNGMTEDYSWDRSCQDYVALYQAAMDEC